MDAAFHLHKDLCPGLLESVYEAVLVRTLEQSGLQVKRQHVVAVDFRGMHFDEGLRVDILVNDCLVVELKSVENLAPIHAKQVLTYLRLDEYPTAALREALVNAVAHRSYDDSSRKIFVRIFRDRIEVASPGYAPKPLTLAKLRRGGYRPCSRNPLIAQTLATLSVMEQRGSGFARMHEAMLNHGLDEPKIEQQDGYFVVTLPGPAGNYDRIKTPANASGLITPAMEAALNDRQKQILT